MTDRSGKNLLLLGQEPPPWRQPDIHEEIAALEVELARGPAIYSAVELEALRHRLDDRKETLRVITMGG